MSTISEQIAARAKKAAKKKTTKKVDESQNRNIRLSYRRFGFWYP